jgi:hypothetical protein
MPFATADFLYVFPRAETHLAYRAAAFAFQFGFAMRPAQFGHNAERVILLDANLRFTL